MPQRCRAFARALEAGAADPHGESCDRCRALAALRDRLPALLGERPAVPLALHSSSLLEAIQDRVSEDVGTAWSLRDAFQQGLTAELDAETLPATWSEALVSSEVTSALRTSPTAPSAQEWRQVRSSVFAGIGGRRLSKVRAAMVVALVGVAASAVLAVVLSTDDNANSIRIEFTDLRAPPPIDYAVVRTGIPR